MKTHNVQSKRPAAKAVTRAARITLEALEQRQMMSTNVYIGTPGNDTWTVSTVAPGDLVIFDGKGGADRVIFGVNNRADNVNGQVVLKNANGGTFQIDVNNSADHAPHTI